MAQRGDKARELFLSGYNCTQSVVGAYADLFDIDFETAMRFADGMGGGMGRMRLTCGAVSAMSLVAGLALSSGKPKDLDNRAEVYAKVQQMAAAFKEKNGSVICRELLGAACPENNSPRPEERTQQYYKKRPCPECVRDCGNILAEYLLPEIEKNK